MSWRKLLMSLLLSLLAVSLAWRWLSRRRSLPCPTWLAGFVEGPVMDRVLGTQTTLDRIGLKPGQRVLEVGPGPGRLLIPAARRVQPGGEVVGLDIQPGMIERLKVRAARAGVSNLTTTLGDATHANVPPESIDVVFLCSVLGEIPDQEAVLQECYKALKLGGVLSITEIFPDPHYQARATIKRLAVSAGFQLAAAYGPWYAYTANFTRPGRRQRSRPRLTGPCASRRSRQASAGQLRWASDGLTYRPSERYSEAWGTA